MNYLKIFLISTVVATIAIIVYFWSVGLPKLGEYTPPTNPFVERINAEIETLSQKPSNVFSATEHQTIQYRIAEYHRDGHLGSNPNDNEQWKEILSKNLYSTYAPKFIAEAFHVFSGSEWNPTDLAVIRRELVSLQRSSYLEPGPVDNSFKIILGVFNKYDEINNFIGGCNGYSYGYDNIDDVFPISEVASRITQAKTYLANELDNEYVNNCTRLREALAEINKVFFNKHLDYLEYKVRQNSGLYKRFSYQSDYSRAIYEPLKGQIEQLDNDIYNVDDNTFQASYDMLESLLEKDNSDAYNYF